VLFSCLVNNATVYYIVVLQNCTVVIHALAGDGFVDGGSGAIGVTVRDRIKHPTTIGGVPQRAVNALSKINIQVQYILFG
jgi:hypothetical protein